MDNANKGLTPTDIQTRRILWQTGLTGPVARVLAALACGAAA